MTLYIQLVLQNVTKDTSVTPAMSPVLQAYLVYSVEGIVCRVALKKNATISVDVQII